MSLTVNVPNYELRVITAMLSLAALGPITNANIWLLP